LRKLRHESAISSDSCRAAALQAEGAIRPLHFDSTGLPGLSKLTGEQDTWRSGLS
jgi:hypothetical protein